VEETVDEIIDPPRETYVVPPSKWRKWKKKDEEKKKKMKRNMRSEGKHMEKTVNKMK
jgi:hypothetical protein